MASLAERGGIDAIVTQAAASNAEIGVTGALIYSGTRFAQILEGPFDGLEALFERIRCDDRHRFEAEIGCEAIAHREFRSWSLCYAGPSLFVARTLATFAKEVPYGRGPADQRMLAMAAGFARIEAPVFSRAGP